MPEYVEYRIITQKDGQRILSEPIPEDLMKKFNDVSKELYETEIMVVRLKKARNVILVQAGLESE